VICDEPKQHSRGETVGGAPLPTGAYSTLSRTLAHPALNLTSHYI
jgi:hypothetical protein